MEESEESIDAGIWINGSGRMLQSCHTCTHPTHAIFTATQAQPQIGEEITRGVVQFMAVVIVILRYVEQAFVLIDIMEYVQIDPFHQKMLKSGWSNGLALLKNQASGHGAASWQLKGQRSK